MLKRISSLYLTFSIYLPSNIQEMNNKITCGISNKHFNHKPQSNGPEMIEMKFNDLNINVKYNVFLLTNNMKIQYVNKQIQIMGCFHERNLILNVWFNDFQNDDIINDYNRTIYNQKSLKNNTLVFDLISGYNGIYYVKKQINYFLPFNSYLQNKTTKHTLKTCLLVSNGNLNWLIMHSLFFY